MSESGSPTYYTGAIYHANFPGVNEGINRAITGHPYRGWMEHVSERYGKLGRVLALNCGNGWVERSLHRFGSISSVLGTDIDQGLLAEARAGAEAAGIRSEYRFMDANAPDLEPGSFECVLNHAALHHVAYIDRLVRALCQALPEHGLLISYDYVGPHRNQYPWESWSEVVRLWGEIPPEDRSELTYPHYKTMLRFDRSEAVHSELILMTISRYFDVIEERGLDGAIAYPLLFQNRKFLDAINQGRHAQLLERILTVDRSFSDGDPARSFFMFQVCRPRKSALADTAKLAGWAAAEREREETAALADGRYGEPGALEHIYDEIASLRYALSLARPPAAT